MHVSIISAIKDVVTFTPIIYEKRINFGYCWLIDASACTLFADSVDADVYVPVPVIADKVEGSMVDVEVEVVVEAIAVADEDVAVEAIAVADVVVMEVTGKVACFVRIHYKVRIEEEDKKTRVWVHSKHMEMWVGKEAQTSLLKRIKTVVTINRQKHK